MHWVSTPLQKHPPPPFFLGTLSSLTSSYLLKVTEFFVKISQFVFLVMTDSHTQPEAMESRNYGMPMNEFYSAPAVMGIITGLLLGCFISKF